jgi:hypothetical protein
MRRRVAALAALTIAAGSVLGMSTGASAASHTKRCSSQGLGANGVVGGAVVSVAVTQLKVRGVACATGQTLAKAIAALDVKSTRLPASTHGFRVSVHGPCAGCTPMTTIVLRKKKNASHMLSFVLARSSSCVDKVGADNTVATIFNNPNGTCDTVGSMTLTVPAGGTGTLTNATLFRTDSTGGNLAASGGHFNRGVWTTQDGTQNVPGNYVAHLFLSTKPNPRPNDFVTISASHSLALAPGHHKIYFFADSDDMAGGTYGFGLNLWIGAASAATPSLSGFVAVPGGAVAVDGTSGCSPAYDGTCGATANTLRTSGSPAVTLSAFTVSALGGAAITQQ